MGVWQGRRRGWTLAVLLGCVAALVFAPGAIAAEGTGKISGTVTAAGSHVDLQNIEVVVYEAGGSELPVGFAVTNASGEYTVQGLASGSYKVEFSPDHESGVNYITQYYHDKASLAAAEPVVVVSGETTEHVEAELQEGGKITGTVTAFTESEDIVPLGNIEVTAYEAGGAEFPVGYATTGAGGEYTMVGLASGSYRVRFSPGLESGLNYVTQYYEGKSSLASANPVLVTQGATTSGIDAELRRGGEIEGMVTDASTHAAVASVYVFAFGADEALAAVTRTNASGHYTIAGLATGSYKIEFAGLESGIAYIPQYFDNEPTLASANPVPVTQGSAVPGIDAALVRKAPVNTAAPVVLGSVAVGQRLSCSKGSWTGSPTPTYAYMWSRNGSAIAGASASTYVVQANDQRTGLACKVTATNRYGSAAAGSGTLTVPAAKAPPPPHPPKPEVKLLSTKILVSGSLARVSISCASATCAGTIELTEQVLVRHRRGRRTISRKKTLVLGTGAYALMVGHSATIIVRLTRTGRSALARARHHRLSVTARVSVIGTTTQYRQVVLVQVPAKHRGRRRR